MMACPTCGHTMQSIVDTTWWCPRCGTLRVGNRHDSLGTSSPRLVDYVTAYFHALDSMPDEAVQLRAAVEECCGGSNEQPERQ